MATERLIRHARWAALALGLGLAAAAAQAQSLPPGPPPSGVAYPAPGAVQAPPESAPRRSRMEIHPYLEVAQVVSAELDSGDVLTYTSVAAGIDAQIHTRRVNVAIGYRYQRNIEWEGDVGDTDMHSGVAMVNVQVVPGVLQFDAGALATRTGGEGRAFGVTDRDASVEVYSAYAGPTLTTHVGPVSVNANYRLGYVAVDDDRPPAAQGEDFDSAVAHSAAASVGMGPGRGRLPVGWNVSAGWARTDTESDFDDEAEGMFVRGDVVVPVSPTLAVTAGVGYENIEASQLDIARDANGVPIIGPDGRPVPDPTRPRVLTYDLDGIIYDAGLIWRPSARTELQVRAGHRYGGTTVVGTFTHQLSPHTGMSAVVYDTVQTMGNLIVNDLSNLPDDFEVDRDPLTGNLGGCVFGSEPGSGVCLGNSLQSIRGSTFRMRGASLVFSGNRGLWSWGVGAGYQHRRYRRPSDPAFDLLGPEEEQSLTVSGSLSRRLSRTSTLGFGAYASWFDSDAANFDSVFSAGASVSYSRSFLLERLRLLAALGLYHSDDGTVDSTVASGLLGLRYTF